MCANPVGRLHSLNLTLSQVAEPRELCASRHEFPSSVLPGEMTVKAIGSIVIPHAEAGGAFSCFGGHILGRNIELVLNERIVQAWRVADWPEGTYSIARFELKTRGSGTRLILDHSGFPQGKREHLAAGWKSRYWEPLRKYLA